MKHPQLASSQWWKIVMPSWYYKDVCFHYCYPPCLELQPVQSDRRSHTSTTPSQMAGSSMWKTLTKPRESHRSWRTSPAKRRVQVLLYTSHEHQPKWSTESTQLPPTIPTAFSCKNAKFCSQLHMKLQGVQTAKAMVKNKVGRRTLPDSNSLQSHHNESVLLAQGRHNGTEGSSEWYSPTHPWPSWQECQSPFSGETASPTNDAQTTGNLQVKPWSCIPHTVHKIPLKMFQWLCYRG